MEKAWPNEKHPCEIVTDKSEKSIQNAMVREFEQREWHRFAKLYGCDKNNNVERAELPRVYATIKSKCIPEGGIILELKSRPITPHTKVTLKRVYNKVASAYLFVLQQIKTQRTCRLWNTQDYVPRATQEIQKLMVKRGCALRTRQQM